MDLILGTQNRPYNFSAMELNTPVHVAYGPTGPQLRFNNTKQSRGKVSDSGSNPTSVFQAGGCGFFFVGRDSGSRGVAWSAYVTYQASG